MAGGGGRSLDMARTSSSGAAGMARRSLEQANRGRSLDMARGVFGPSFSAQRPLMEESDSDTEANPKAAFDAPKPALSSPPFGQDRPSTKDTPTRILGAQTEQNREVPLPVEPRP
eukprot:CAMPEP_0202811348 /NCGR_PEP_ID=MMETSP1389-20130828/3238_1 /ASSEMBLY_ACC=CAM_ASM_000865 /TAXON_ID=302021 /ORGANISM="Rhodomonas sp., Strain CCMP768" /LENGTH=114 /DNA_ID=CAMNT_0049482449 /DNA_START=1 /DNA_END=342 /DNA_ORIENTATION=-